MIHAEYPTALFKKNRQKLTRLMQRDSLAVVFCNDQMPRNGDVLFPYRQHSDMYYLSGIMQEDTCLLLCPDHQDPSFREVLFIHDYDPQKALWEGKKLAREEAAEISGVERIASMDDFDTILEQALTKVGVLYYNPNENNRFSTPLVYRDLRYRAHVAKHFPHHAILSLAPLLTELRLRKEPDEIALIKKACAITRDTFLSLLAAVRPGMWEYEIEALINYHFTRNKAARHAFDPIVASGENACVLHYIENNKRCADGSMVLIDFGAEYSMYASDCTRTIPINGKMTKRQAAVYQATLDVLKYAKAIIGPGESIQHFHEKVCRYEMEKHIALGLYSQEDVERYTGEKPIWQRYYMHGTSHFIGLDVHDVGGKELVLEPGMLISCEPAIYIKEEGLGIRLENDLLITEKGNVDLLEDVPIEVEEIESLMQQARGNKQ